MRSGLQNRPLVALAVAVILVAALFGAFGHADHHHGAQPCAACSVTILLTLGLLLAGFILNTGPQGRRIAPVRTDPAPRRRHSSKRAQRAPPVA